MMPCTYGLVLGVGERPSDRGMNVASVHRADVCTHRDTHSVCTQRQVKICTLIVLETSADCSKAELWISSVRRSCLACMKPGFDFFFSRAPHHLDIMMTPIIIAFRNQRQGDQSSSATLGSLRLAQATRDVSREKQKLFFKQ